MNVQYKNVVITIIIAFVLMLGISFLLDTALNEKLSPFADIFMALVFAIPVGFVISLVRSNWGKEKRSPKED